MAGPGRVNVPIPWQFIGELHLDEQGRLLFPAVDSEAGIYN